MADTEAEVMQEVKQIIALTGIKLQRINTGTFGSRHVKTANPGTCDFEGYDNHGRFVAIECKRPVGGKITPEQEERIDDINAKGGVAFVARSGQEALQKLKENHCIG